MAPGRMDRSPNSGSIQPHLSRKNVFIRLLVQKWYNSSCRLSDRAEKHSPILYEPRLPTAEGKALKQPCPYCLQSVISLDWHLKMYHAEKVPGWTGAKAKEEAVDSVVEYTLQQ